MSATLRPDWLKTVDFADSVDSLDILEMSDKDKAAEAFQTRVYASKPLAKAPFDATETKKAAACIIENHQPGSRTLAVVNTVQRAQSLYREIKKQKPRAYTVLIHSRFRPPDRAKALERMLAEPGPEGTICVATQVIEAGVDTSSAILYTELAPWSSLVQRFGRCNRDGQEKQPAVIWSDMDLSKKGAASPYDAKDLEKSRRQLESIAPDVQPAELPPPNTTPTYQHVIRRKDLIDLFDTTPDLAGGDIDVSRFIRDTNEMDVQVFWRSLDGRDVSPEEPASHRDELCRVPVAALKQNRDWPIWRWDHLDRQWTRIFSSNEIYPGLILLLDASSGGYSKELGWTGDKKDVPETISLAVHPEEGNDDDPYTISEWTSLAEHTDDVAEVVNFLVRDIPINHAPLKDALHLAARWHDAGKAHPVFQNSLCKGRQPPYEPEIWGKAAIGNISYERKGFRHELASAIAMLENGQPDLAAYLAAAHHGKVRVSIRSLPNEQYPPDPEIRFARGIWDGDVLPEADLGGGVVLPETTMDLSCMSLGEGPKGHSWLSRVISLRENPDIGPFRLSFLEAILRVADWRASMKRQKGDE
ncbi:MAG: CRISPR-associated helicase Cas3' [Desulfosalsimonas sp.]